MATNDSLQTRVLMVISRAATIGLAVYFVVGAVVSLWLVTRSPLDPRSPVERVLDFMAGLLLWPMFLARWAADS